MTLLSSSIFALLCLVGAAEDCSLLQMKVQKVDAQSILDDHSDDDAHIAELRDSVAASTDDLVQHVVDTFSMIPGVVDAADEVRGHGEFNLLIEQVLHLSSVVQAVADHVSQMISDPSAAPELNVDMDFDPVALENAHRTTVETMQGYVNAERRANLVLGVHSFFAESGQYWTGATGEFALMEQQLRHLVDAVQALVDQVEGVRTDPVIVSDETISEADFDTLHAAQAMARDSAMEALGASILNYLPRFGRVVELGHQGAHDHHALMGAVEARIQHLHAAVQALADQVNNL
jgi:hypothetical protein